MIPRKDTHCPHTMHILFFDTETNGLPRTRCNPTAADYPSIVQLAWQLWESTPTGNRLLSRHSHIVRPPMNIVWNLESQGFHKITHQQAMDEGMYASDVIRLFRDDLGTADMIVAHNLTFDFEVLNAEAERRGIPPLVWPARSLCTMKESKDFCKLPSASRHHSDYKYPKLSELHTLLFGSTDDITFHNADHDVEATQQCFYDLIRRRVLRRPDDRLFLETFLEADASAL